MSARGFFIPPGHRGGPGIGKKKSHSNIRSRVHLTRKYLDKGPVDVVVTYPDGSKERKTIEENTAMVFIDKDIDSSNIRKAVKYLDPDRKATKRPKPTAAQLSALAKGRAKLDKIRGKPTKTRRVKKSKATRAIIEKLPTSTETAYGFPRKIRNMSWT